MNTTIENTTFAVRINKSNIEEFQKILKRAKTPNANFRTTEGIRPLREGDFVLNTETAVTLSPGGTEQLNIMTAVVGVFSKSQFKKHFGSPKQNEGVYIITSDLQELI